MILILLAIVVLMVISVVLMWYGNEGYSGIHTALCVTGFIGLFLSGTLVICYVFAGWNWMAAEHKADIINREYGTNYTQSEVFYASDVIETVRQLDRKRYEINGDLMREEKK